MIKKNSLSYSQRPSNLTQSANGTARFRIAGEFQKQEPRQWERKKWQTKKRIKKEGKGKHQSRRNREKMCEEKIARTKISKQDGEEKKEFQLRRNIYADEAIKVQKSPNPTKDKGETYQNRQNLQLNCQNFQTTHQLSQDTSVFSKLFNLTKHLLKKCTDYSSKICASLFNQAQDQPQFGHEWIYIDKQRKGENAQRKTKNKKMQESMKKKKSKMTKKQRQVARRARFEEDEGKKGLTVEKGEQKVGDAGQRKEKYLSTYRTKILRKQGKQFLKVHKKFKFSQQKSANSSRKLKICWKNNPSYTHQKQLLTSNRYCFQSPEISSLFINDIIGYSHHSVQQQNFDHNQDPPPSEYLVSKGQPNNQLQASKQQSSLGSNPMVCNVLFQKIVDQQKKGMPINMEASPQYSNFSDKMKKDALKNKELAKNLNKHQLFKDENKGFNLLRKNIKLLQQKEKSLQEQISKRKAKILSSKFLHPLNRDLIPQVEMFVEPGSDEDERKQKINEGQVMDIVYFKESENNLEIPIVANEQEVKEGEQISEKESKRQKEQKQEINRSKKNITEQRSLDLWNDRWQLQENKSQQLQDRRSQKHEPTHDVLHMPGNNSRNDWIYPKQNWYCLSSDNICNEEQENGNADLKFQNHFHHPQNIATNIENPQSDNFDAHPYPERYLCHQNINDQSDIKRRIQHPGHQQHYNENYPHLSGEQISHALFYFNCASHNNIAIPSSQAYATSQRTFVNGQIYQRQCSENHPNHYQENCKTKFLSPEGDPKNHQSIFLKDQVKQLLQQSQYKLIHSKNSHVINYHLSQNPCHTNFPLLNPIDFPENYQYPRQSHRMATRQGLDEKKNVIWHNEGVIEMSGTIQKIQNEFKNFYSGHHQHQDGDELYGQYKGGKYFSQTSQQNANHNIGINMEVNMKGNMDGCGNYLQDFEKDKQLFQSYVIEESKFGGDYFNQDPHKPMRQLYEEEGALAQQEQPHYPHSMKNYKKPATVLIDPEENQQQKANPQANNSNRMMRQFQCLSISHPHPHQKQDNHPVAFLNGLPQALEMGEQEEIIHEMVYLREEYYERHGGNENFVLDTEEKRRQMDRIILEDYRERQKREQKEGRIKQKSNYKLNASCYQSIMEYEFALYQRYMQQNQSSDEFAPDELEFLHSLIPQIQQQNYDIYSDNPVIVNKHTHPQYKNIFVHQQQWDQMKDHITKERYNNLVKCKREEFLSQLQETKKQFNLLRQQVKTIKGDHAIRSIQGIYDCRKQYLMLTDQELQYQTYQKICSEDVQNFELLCMKSELYMELIQIYQEQLDRNTSNQLLVKELENIILQENGSNNDNIVRVSDLSSIQDIRDDSFFQRPGINHNYHQNFISLHDEESEDHKDLQQLSNIINTHSNRSDNEQSIQKSHSDFRNEELVIDKPPQPHQQEVAQTFQQYYQRLRIQRAQRIKHYQQQAIIEIQQFRLEQQRQSEQMIGFIQEVRDKLNLSRKERPNESQERGRSDMIEEMKMLTSNIDHLRISQNSFNQMNSRHSSVGEGQDEGYIESSIPSQFISHQEEEYWVRFSDHEIYDENGEELEEIAVIRKTRYDDVYPMGIYKGRKRRKNIRQMVEIGGEQAFPIDY